MILSIVSAICTYAFFTSHDFLATSRFYDNVLYIKHILFYVLLNPLFGNVRLITKTRVFLKYIKWDSFLCKIVI